MMQATQFEKRPEDGQEEQYLRAIRGLRAHSASEKGPVSAAWAYDTLMPIT